MPEDHLPKRARQGASTILDWSTVDKCILVLAITFGFAASFSAMLEYYFRHESWAPYMDRARWGTSAWPMWIEAGLLLLFTAAGFLVRKRSPENAVYVHLTNHAVWLNNVFYCQMIGYYTTPMGITFLGAAFACFLFFGLRPVFYAMGTAIAAMLGLAVLERTGGVPYAELLHAAPFGPDGRLYTSWVFAAGIPGLAFTVVIIWLCTFTIARWREREEKLAQAYAALRRAKDQLVRAESLAAVGSLVSGAAHELRNPLGSAASLMQLVLEDLRRGSLLSEEETKDAAETLEKALQSEGRARAILDRLYQLSDDLVTEKSSASLSVFLEGIGRNYPGVEVKNEGIASTVRVPEAVVQTVIPNLLQNALASQSKSPPRLTARWNAEGVLHLEIEDTGCGIPAAQMKEVFKPFFSGARATGGARVGLGLYIVHELVTRMGGSVELESEEGKGTRVRVRLPIEAAP